MVKITHANKQIAEKLAKKQKQKGQITLHFKAGIGKRVKMREEVEHDLQANGLVYVIEEMPNLFFSNFIAHIWFRKRKQAYCLQEVVNRFSPLGNTRELSDHYNNWIEQQKRV